MKCLVYDHTNHNKQLDNLGLLVEELGLLGVIDLLAEYCSAKGDDAEDCGDHDLSRAWDIKVSRLWKCKEILSLVD